MCSRKNWIMISLSKSGRFNRHGLDRDLVFSNGLQATLKLSRNVFVRISSKIEMSFRYSKHKKNNVKISSNWEWLRQASTFRHLSINFRSSFGFFYTLSARHFPTKTILFRRFTFLISMIIIRQCHFFLDVRSHSFRFLLHQGPNAEWNEQCDNDDDVSKNMEWKKQNIIPREHLFTFDGTKHKTKIYCSDSKQQIETREAEQRTVETHGMAHRIKWEINGLHSNGTRCNARCAFTVFIFSLHFSPVDSIACLFHVRRM